MPSFIKLDKDIDPPPRTLDSLRSGFKELWYGPLPIAAAILMKKISCKKPSAEKAPAIEQPVALALSSGGPVYKAAKNEEDSAKNDESPEKKPAKSTTALPYQQGSHFASSTGTNAEAFMKARID